MPSCSRCAPIPAALVPSPLVPGGCNARAQRSPPAHHAGAAGTRASARPARETHTSGARWWPGGGPWWPVAVGHAGAPACCHQREPKCHEAWPQPGHGRPSLRRRGAGPRHGPGRQPGNCHPSMRLANPPGNPLPAVTHPGEKISVSVPLWASRGAGSLCPRGLPPAASALPQPSCPCSEFEGGRVWKQQLQQQLRGFFPCTLGQPRIASLTSGFLPVQLITQHYVQTQSGDEETALITL